METQKLSTMFSRYTTAMFGALTTIPTTMPTDELWFKCESGASFTLATCTGGIRVTNTTAQGLGYICLPTYIKPRLPAQVGYEAMVQMTFRTKSSGPFHWGLEWGTKNVGSRWSGSGFVAFGIDGKLRICSATDGNACYHIVHGIGNTDLLADTIAVPNYSYTEWTTWDLTLILPSGGSNQAIRAILSINQRVARETEIVEDAVHNLVADIISGGVRPVISLPIGVSVDVAMLGLTRS